MRGIGLKNSFRFASVAPLILLAPLAVYFVFVLLLGYRGVARTGDTLLSMLVSILLSASICVIAAPFSLSLAACLYLISDRREYGMLRQTLNILAATPPVVCAYVAMTLLRETSWVYSYRCALAVLVLAFLPRLCVHVLDSLNSVPRHYYYSSLSLGMNGGAAVMRVIMRKARGGIIESLLLTGANALNELALLQLALGFVSGIPVSSIVVPVAPVTLLIRHCVRQGDMATASFAALSLLGVGFALSYCARSFAKGQIT